jgi:hypothetical protein
MVARLTGAIARGEVEKMSRRIKRKIQDSGARRARPPPRRGTLRLEAG